MDLICATSSKVLHITSYCHLKLDESNFHSTTRCPLAVRFVTTETRVERRRRMAAGGKCVWTRAQSPGCNFSMTESKGRTWVSNTRDKRVLLAVCAGECLCRVNGGRCVQWLSALNRPNKLFPNWQQKVHLRILLLNNCFIVFALLTQRT